MSRKVIHSLFIFIVGLVLGVISKALDETASNHLPFFLEVLDLGNFFSRMGIWLFFAVIISLYSQSPMRSAIHVFLFFSGMVSSYYLYTIFIAGFFPKSYMMIWVAMTFLSPILAYISWYAKGKGTIALIISSIIFMFMARQAFAFGFWYFSVRYVLELLLLIGAAVVLYQSPRQISKVIILGMLLFFLLARVPILWGML